MDKYHGQGGSYTIKDGVRVQSEAPTKDHPDGNRPRDKDGKPITQAAAEAAALPAPATPTKSNKGV